MAGRIGFIGGGMMAEALIKGVLSAGRAKAADVIASDVSEERRRHLEGRLGIGTTARNADVIDFAQTVILAVKPQHAAAVLDEVGERLRPAQLVISIMAGVTTGWIESRIAPGVPVVRAMPNICCVVGEGAAAVAAGSHAGPGHLEAACALLSSAGRAVTVEERLMDAVTGLSGSGPAFVFAVIEALADGGVAEGLPRATALTLAAQTVLGAAKLVLESGEHPAVLRDRVASPAGTTIEGLGVLEQGAVRGAFASAVRAAARRSKALGEG